MKKILSFAICLALLVSVLLVLPAHVSAASASGVFGDGMSWSFDDETGTLVISGDGPISDLDYLSWTNGIDACEVTTVILVV